MKKSVTKKLAVLFLGLSFTFLFSKERPIQIVFAHGLGGSYTGQGKNYKKLLFDFATQGDYSFFGQDFPENYDTNQVSLCQKPEACIFNNALKGACIQDDQPIILCGVSRGAATVLTSRTYDPELHKKVFARIIEAPFSSFESLLKRHPLYGWLPSWLTKKLLIKIAAPNANINGIMPIEAVSQFPNDQTPTLIICSKTDAIVSWEESRDLAVALKKAGNKNVHLLVLEKGKHAKLLKLNSKEGDLYREVVRQFLAKYIYQKSEDFSLLNSTLS